MRTSYEFRKENNCNKTISCYQRPIIFYIINNIKNKRKTNKEKSFNFSNNNIKKI